MKTEEIIDLKKEIAGIITAYEELVKNVDATAKADVSRAYGGIIRSGKGKLVEGIARHLIDLAWANIGGDPRRLNFDGTKIKVPFKKEYLSRIKEPQVKEYLENNLSKFFYSHGTDVHTYIDGKLVLAVECKTYTENAMLKRILVDFTLLKEQFPELECVLLQLESQLCGDYCELNDITYGSATTHTLLSYFDIDLKIITLLKGERKVDKPIHKKEFYKEIKEEDLLKAIKIFEEILIKFI